MSFKSFMSFFLMGAALSFLFGCTVYDSSYESPEQAELRVFNDGLSGEVGFSTSIWRGPVTVTRSGFVSTDEMQLTFKITSSEIRVFMGLTDIPMIVRLENLALVGNTIVDLNNSSTRGQNVGSMGRTSLIISSTGRDYLKVQRMRNLRGVEVLRMTASMARGYENLSVSGDLEFIQGAY